MRRILGRPLILVLGVAMAAMACSSSTKSANNGSGATTTAAGAPNVKKGGNLVIGAEQWPDCINPITQCANSSWMFWVTDQQVLPKLMYLDQKNNFKASPVITEAPTAANGGLKNNPFTLTYHLDPKAVWDDMSPITCDDVSFTEQAYLKTTGTLSTVGYDQVDNIACPDPKTVVITFKAPFADWPDMFGGNQGHVLKKAAFPNGPDVSKDMQTSLPFSGTPWKLQSFSKDQAVLVPNTNYWVKADLPYLDQVTFVPRTDQDTEITSLLTGEVSAIYPQPSPGYTKKLTGSNVQFTATGGFTIEGLWYNLSKAPMNDVKVRQAVSMAVDRSAIVDTIIHPDTPKLGILNCSGIWVSDGPWCDNSYQDLKYDPAGAKTILQADGWTLGADGIFAKGGTKLDLELNTVTGNTRRENIEQLVIQQAKAAGIGMHVKNYDRTTLFQTVIPHLNHTIGIYAQVASSDPSVTSIFACDQIPSAANKFSGQNDDAWCNQQATTLMQQSDATVDPTARATIIKQVGKLVHDDWVWLPFYQLPLTTAWRTDKVAGPVDDYTGSSLVFYNLNKWHQP